MVAALKPPRGMPASVAPQFVLLAHMGAVGRDAYDLVGSVTGSREVNGCLVRGTMFATLEGTREHPLAGWAASLQLASPDHRHAWQYRGAGCDQLDVLTWQLAAAPALSPCLLATSPSPHPQPARHPLPQSVPLSTSCMAPGLRWRTSRTPAPLWLGWTR